MSTVTTTNNPTASAAIQAATHTAKFYAQRGSKNAEAILERLKNNTVSLVDVHDAKRILASEERKNSSSLGDISAAVLLAPFTLGLSLLALDKNSAGVNLAKSLVKDLRQAVKAQGIGTTIAETYRDLFKRA